MSALAWLRRWLGHAQLEPMTELEARQALRGPRDEARRTAGVIAVSPQRAPIREDAPLEDAIDRAGARLVAFHRRSIGISGDSAPGADENSPYSAS